MNSRLCGPCTVCCVVPVLPKTAKPVGKKEAGVPCSKLTNTCSAGGCSIYSTRPKVCREYECQWKVGWFTDEDRPDKSGLLVEYRNQQPLGMHVAFIEARPGAATSTQGKQMIESVANREVVTICPSYNRSISVNGPSIRMIEIKKKLERA